MIDLEIIQKIQELETRQRSMDAQFKAKGKKLDFVRGLLIERIATLEIEIAKLKEEYGRK